MRAGRLSARALTCSVSVTPSPGDLDPLSLHSRSLYFTTESPVLLSSLGSAPSAVPYLHWTTVPRPCRAVAREGESKRGSESERARESENDKREREKERKREREIGQRERGFGSEEEAGSEGREIGREKEREKGTRFVREVTGGVCRADPQGSPDRVTEK